MAQFQYHTPFWFGADGSPLQDGCRVYLIVGPLDLRMQHIFLWAHGMSVMGLGVFMVTRGPFGRLVSCCRTLQRAFRSRRRARNPQEPAIAGRARAVLALIAIDRHERGLGA